MNFNQNWHTELVEQMVQPGKEERQIAIDKGDVDAKGVPFITVYAAGGWSHRAYKHSFSALSGVVRIIQLQLINDKFNNSFKYSILGNYSWQSH